MGGPLSVAEIGVTESCLVRIHCHLNQCIPSSCQRNPVTRLLAQNCHRIQGHSGPSQVLASIRQIVWVIRGLSGVRRILAGFMKYRKRNAHPGEQIMAPLPEARVSVHRLPV